MQFYRVEGFCSLLFTVCSPTTAIFGEENASEISPQKHDLVRARWREVVYGALVRHLPSAWVLPEAAKARWLVRGVFAENKAI